MLGKKSKCRIKNGKQGAGGVESSKKEKMKCVCGCVCVCACACGGGGGGGGHHPQTLTEVKHRPPSIMLGIFQINFITATIDY